VLPGADPGNHGREDHSATLSFGALSAFVSGRERRSEEPTGPGVTATAGRAPAVADRSGLYALRKTIYGSPTSLGLAAPSAPGP
jgi:hypothetical protein